MSVVARETRLRWAAVGVGLALVLSAPTLTSRALPVAAGPVSSGDPAALLRRVMSSGEVPHAGLAESRGSLGLPDLPRLGGVAALLGSTTRSRVWWSGPRSWRVDVLTPTGEQDAYGFGSDVVTWDYERRSLTRSTAFTDVRLPRADDLLPPQVARRVLGSVGPQDALRVVGRQRVAGRPATLLRVVPGDADATLARVDVWVDDASGLPLEVRLVGTGDVDALVARFLEVDTRSPATDTLHPPDAPGARLQPATPDLASQADIGSPWVLPPSLSGYPSSPVGLGGTGVYGDGLARFVVVPVTDDVAAGALRAAEDSGAVRLQAPGGQSALIGTPLLNAVVARAYDRRHAYVVAGLVSPELLEQATRELLADPPPPRAGVTP